MCKKEIRLIEDDYGCQRSTTACRVLFLYNVFSNVGKWYVNMLQVWKNKDFQSLMFYVTDMRNAIFSFVVERTKLINDLPTRLTLANYIAVRLVQSMENLRGNRTKKKVDLWVSSLLFKQNS